MTPKLKKEGVPMMDHRPVQVSPASHTVTAAQ